MKDWWEEDDYGDWNFYNIKFNHFPWSVDIESCVYETYWTDFRDAKKHHHKSTLDNLSEDDLALLF